MMKLLWMGLILLAGGLRAQNLPMNTMRDQLNSSGLVIPANGTVWGLPSGNKGELLGTPYLDTLWSRGNIKLYQSLQPIGGKPVDSLSGLGMRYNVQFDEIEILLNTYKDVKAVKGDHIRSFSLSREGSESVFINTRSYVGEKLPPGFLEIVSPGKLTLAAFHKIVVKKPTYNVAFDTGTKDTALVPDEELYIVQNGRATKWKPSKKNVLELMRDRSGEVNAYLKEHGPDFKNYRAVAAVFAYYNRMK